MSFISSSPTAARDEYIVLQGNLKKLKTNKRRYFVLFRECRDAEQPSRLDYYENEKKFRQKGAVPKRSIVLRSCFHIGQRRDTKHKHVISLYTKDDCFCLLMDTEVDLRRWLKAMLDLHSHEFVGVKRKAIDHVWHVQVQRKGLAEEHSITGAYHLCLTSQAVSLVRVGPETVPGGELRRESIEFPLVAIRRCGDSQCFFYMEVGRFSCIGQGELWMGTEAPLIAQNMHSTIMHAMAVCKTNEDRDEFGPVPRGRSSSANEASKPISLMHRRQTHVGGGVGGIGGINSKPMNFSPVSDDLSEAASVDVVGFGSRRNAPHQPDLLPPVPSSPLSTSTLSGSGSTVIQLDLYKLPELPAGRTSTPLKVVPARMAPKHGFYVASTTSGGPAAAPNAPANTGRGGGSGGFAVDDNDHIDDDDDDANDDDNDYFDDNYHDAGDNCYMLHVPMRSDEAPPPTPDDNGTGYVECFPAAAGGGGGNGNGSVHAACLGRPTNATHSEANGPPPANAAAPISYHHQRALSLPISAPPPLLLSANSNSSATASAFATSNGTNTIFTSSSAAAGAATAAASSASFSSATTTIANSNSVICASAVDESSHIVGQFHTTHPLIVVAQHQHQHHQHHHHHHNHHHNSNTMHNHHHSNHHHLNHQHHSTTAAASAGSASAATSKVTLPLLHHSLKPFHQRTRSLPLTEETAIEIHTYHNDDNQQQEQQQQLDNRPLHHGHHVRAVSTDQTNNNSSHNNHFNHNNHHNNSLNNNNQQRRMSVDRGLLTVPRIVVPAAPLTIDGGNDDAMAEQPTAATSYQSRGAEMPAASSVLRQLLASIDVAQLNGSNADMLKLLTAGSCGLNNNNNSSSGNCNNNNIGGGIGGGGATISSSAAAKRSKRGSGASGSGMLLSPPTTATATLGSNHPRQRSMPSATSSSVCAGCVAGDCCVVIGGGGGGGGGVDGRGQGNLGCGGGEGVCLSSRNATGRERCDSLPSRARTVSDTTPNAAAAAAAAAAAESAAMPPPPPRIGGGMQQQRPHSLYQQAAMLRHSSSPPMGLGGGALSPSMLLGGGVGGSGCSESDGSSLSIDETDGYNSHSMTPDESHQFSSRYFSSRTSGSVIPEENGDECWPTPTTSSSPQVIAATGSLANAVVAQHLMHHNHHSLHNHLHQHQLHQQNGGGGGSLSSSAASASAQSAAQLLASALHKSSPSGTSSHSLMGRFSPCGSSPGDNQISAGAYMLMSPREENKSLYTNSSGASSLAEDLYVPNDPPPMHIGEEYMDMMEQRNSRLSNNPGSGVRGNNGGGGNAGAGSHHNHDTCGGGSGMNSVASSCSITSGTPSTDLRFGEYQLDKVISIFTPDEEDPSLQAMDRPTRAYSVGSRLEHNKRKLAMEHRMPGDQQSSQSSSSSVSGGGNQQQQQQPLSAQSVHMHLQQKQPSSRLRAFSVGAKVPRSDSYRGVVIQKAPLSTVFMKKDSNGFTSSTSSNSSNVSGSINNNPHPHHPHHQKSASVSMLHTYREQHLLQQQQLQLQQLQQELPAAFAATEATTLVAGKSSLPKTDAMDDLMEIDFTSSSTASSSGAGGGGGVCAMNEDGCGDITMHSNNGPAANLAAMHTSSPGSLSGSPLVKSQPMSVPMARKLGDDHHPGHNLHQHHQPHHLHHLSGGSRGIDPPNGYVPMRPTLKTAASSLESTTMAMPMPVPMPAPTAHLPQMAGSTGSTGSMNSASFGNANPYMCMKPVGSAGSASNSQHNPTVIAATAAPQQSASAHSFAFAQHHGSPSSVAGLAEVMRNANHQRSGSQSAANSDYLPMSPSQEHSSMRLSASPAAARLMASATATTTSPMTTPTTPTMPMSPPVLLHTQQQHQQQQQQQQTSAPEGYMEMKFVRPTSNSSGNVNNNDSRSAHRSSTTSHSPATGSSTSANTTRLSSQPINIAQPARKSTDHTSTNNPEAAAQRKHIGSLSLAVKSRVRCDSKDSGIVTPTGTSAHSAIFPFSPSSPKTGSMDEARAAALAMATTTAAAASRKCMIDATNGTVHLVAGGSGGGGSNIKSASVLAEFGRSQPSEQPKVQNKDATPMQVDTLSNDYADMTLDVKPQQPAQSLATTVNAASASVSAGQPPVAQMPTTFPLAMPSAQHAAPTTPNVRKTSNLQRPQLQLSSARETTNADYTLMKPSYPYPKKKPLLVQINNNLTNATSKTNATAFRSIAASSQQAPLSVATASFSAAAATVAPCTRMQTSPPQTPTTPQPLPPTISAATSTAAASPSPSTTGGSGPYELLLMRPNSVAQDKVVVKQLNTPLARSSSANSDRLLLSPSCRSQTSSSNSNSSSSSSSQTITAPSSSSSLSAAAAAASSATTTSTSQSSTSSSSSSSTVRPVSVSSTSTTADESSSGGGVANSSRPPSVSSERELYYASLDLPATTATTAPATTATTAALATALLVASSSENEDDDGSYATLTPPPKAGATADAPATGNSSAETTPPPAVNGFCYAQIDFVKSGEQIKTEAADAATTAQTAAATTATNAATAPTSATAAAIKVDGGLQKLSKKPLEQTN